MTTYVAKKEMKGKMTTGKPQIRHKVERNRRASKKEKKKLSPLAMSLTLDLSF